MSMNTKSKIALEVAVKAALKHLTTARTACEVDGHVCAPPHMQQAIAHLQQGLKAAGADRQEGNG